MAKPKSPRRLAQAQRDAAWDEVARRLAQTQRNAPPETVAEYFNTKLGSVLQRPPGDDGTQPWSPANPDFHINTGCGIECKQAIDAAASLILHLQAAGCSEYRQSIIDATHMVVRIYVYG